MNIWFTICYATTSQNHPYKKIEFPQNNIEINIHLYDRTLIFAFEFPNK